MTNVVPLHPRQPALAGFLRVGYNDHRKLESMLNAGRLKYRRFVFDAAHIVEQQDLLNQLHAAQYEIVLDTNFTEMFFQGKFGRSITRLPWANHDRPWSAADFSSPRNFDVAQSIAEFAIKFGVSAVLAPAFVVTSNSKDAVQTNYRLCEALRDQLDARGGSHIKIDYLCSFTSPTFRDRATRRALLADVGRLPVNNLWIRAEGFGAKSTGVFTRLVIEALRELHEENLPIVIDYAGGLAGLSLLAFGAAGGLSHGVAEKETFNISSWKKSGSGGGGGNRVYVAELDRHIDASRLRTLFEARGAKSKVGCNDRDCCPQLQDMFDRSDDHFIVQRSKQLSILAGIPTERRAEHFILDFVGHTIRSARAISNIKFQDSELEKYLNENKKRLLALEETLVDLKNKMPLPTLSRIPAFRGGTQLLTSAVAG